MTRTKSFDPTKILEKAMHLFREKGYEATSLKDLEHETGLKAGSLYHSFESKHALFQAALAHYNQSIVQTRIKTFLNSAPGIAGLEAMFLSMLEEPDGRMLGCLLTNSAIEFGPSQTMPTELIDAGFNLLENAFKKHISQGQKQGLICQAISPGQAALQLLLFYQGTLVLIRFKRDKAKLAVQVKQFLKKYHATQT